MTDKYWVEHFRVSLVTSFGEHETLLAAAVLASDSDGLWQHWGASCDRGVCIARKLTRRKDVRQFRGWGAGPLATPDIGRTSC